MKNNVLSATEKALDLVRELEQETGALMFHLSGGCCDGSAPMCYQKGNFIVGSKDLLLGYILNHPFYISEDQYSYLEHCELILDVTEGRGSSFSIEIPKGKRFLIRSKLHQHCPTR